MKILTFFKNIMLPFLAVYIIWVTYPKTIFWPISFDYILNDSVSVKSNETPDEIEINTDGYDFVRDLGTFGDVFGSLNTLFSGLAFAGIIISIRLQSSELQETRNEMARQSKQFESQANALEKQVFENTFFQLLEFNNEIINSANIDQMTALPRGGRGVLVNGVGRKVFKELHGFLMESLLVNYDCNSGEIYEEFHVEFGDTLGHYFRNIYQIIKYIDGSVFSNQDKKYYSNLLRAQLSKFEIGLLFYNCLSVIGNEKFKPLLEKYEFFEHLADDIDTKYIDLLSYDISVFGWSNRACFKRHMLSKAWLVKDNPEKYILLIYRDNTSSVERLEAVDVNIESIEQDILNHVIIWLEYESI